MGLCRTCQRDAGWLSHECSDCRAKREAAQAAAAAAERAEAERERQAKIDAMVETAVTELKTTVGAGGTARLYDSLVVDLDEGSIDRAGMDKLRDVGERGWQVITTSPHFHVSKTYQGAVSDLQVDCAQVLVELAVTSANIGCLDGEIRAYYGIRAAEEVDEQRKGREAKRAWPGP